MGRSGHAPITLIAFVIFPVLLLTILAGCSGPASNPDAPPFAKTLAGLGATTGEVDKMIAAYKDAPPELKPLFESNDPGKLKGFLEYERSVWAGEAAHPVLKPGAAMPDFALKGVDGKIYTPARVKESKLVVIAFISNHCPASQLYEDRFKKLVADYRTQGVAFLAIQPDGPSAAAPSEHNYSDVEDDFAGMQERARFRNFTFPYLDDGEVQAATKAFGPKSTPQLFVFDGTRKLRFEGRIDNNLNAAKATTHEARDAIDALLAGKQVAVAHTPVFGCSIKWNDHKEGAEREAKEWAAMPVTLQNISNAGLTALRVTPPGKVTIINFWATWCGPCRVEMPEIVKSWQWYRSRDVDLVTVSVDDPAARPKVQAFLEKLHVPARNYLVSSTDVYAVQAAFDPGWQSGVPLTVVLGADGKVLYRQEGELDVLKMRRAILANLKDAGPFAGNAAYWGG